MIWSLAFAAMSAAAGAIQIGPGESTTIPAMTSQPTVVSCVVAPASGAGSAPRGSEGFCFCKANGVDDSVQYQLRKVTTTQAGERSETLLKSYDTQKGCDQGVRNYPPCL